MKVKDYKGFEIHLDGRGDFEAFKDGDVETRADTLKSLEEKIDKIFKKISVRFKAFKKGSENSEVFVEIIVTSVNPIEGTIWGTEQNGGRQKYNLHWAEIFKDIPENKKVFEVLTELYKQRNKLEEVIQKEENKLVKLVREDIGYKKE